MKKIYSILLLATFTLAFSACSDDQDQVGSEYSRASTVKVTSSNLVFSAAAGTGTLVFEAPSTATVSVDAQWASAVVNGNKVDVSVKKNPKLEGRSALLTIKCGDDSTQVTVQQRGMMFKYGGETSQFIYNDAARTISIPVKNEGSNLSIKGLDWAEASINDETINIKLSENKTGHIRSGIIKYTTGPYTDSIYVCQGEKKDIVNKTYYLGGYDLMKITENTKSIDEVFSVTKVMVAEMKDQLLIYFPDTNWILPMKLDEGSLSFDINAGEYMGMYYNYYHIFSGVVDYGYLSSFLQNEIGFVFASSNYKLSISGYFDYNDEQNATIAFMGDNNFNDSLIKQLTGDEAVEYDANTLGFFIFNSDQVTKNSFKGIASLYYRPFMMEITPKSAKGTVLEFGKSANQDEVSKQAVLENVKKQLRSHPFSGKLPSEIGKILR